VLQVSRSAFYDWLEHPAKIISEDALNIYRMARQLFKRSHGRLGSRQLCKNLERAGFNPGRYCTRSIMRKHSDSVADNVLNQQFNPKQANLVCPGNVTYFRTN